MKGRERNLTMVYRGLLSLAFEDGLIYVQVLSDFVEDKLASRLRGWTDCSSKVLMSRLRLKNLHMAIKGVELTVGKELVFTWR